MEHHVMHKRVWIFLRWLLVPWLRWKFDYSYEEYPGEGEGPVLVMANHDTDWDPLLLACAFPKQMYFVASEHIFRWGILSKLIVFFLGPISRLKGTTASNTVMTILRRLKKGANVAMFANGSRSFNGISEDILPSTGKLARVSGATLVTYRIDGGYFTQPRWNSSGLRRGKLSGRVVNVYTPQQLKKMSVDEVNEAINRDLYVDAYAVQRERMVPFKGKALAEGLERVLCLCPKCGSMGQLKGVGNEFACSCGHRLSYNNYGFLEGEDAVFDSITDWDKYQTAKFIEMAEAAGSDGLIFRDEGFSLTEILPGHETAPAGSGSLALYADKVECCGLVMPISELGSLAMHGPVAMNFCYAGRDYELIPDSMLCTRKYMTVFQFLKERSAVNA